jgi:hypothetical protein
MAGGDAVATGVAAAVTGFFTIATLLLTAGCCTGTVMEVVVGFDWGCTSAGICACSGGKACNLTDGRPLFVPSDWVLTCLVKAAKSCAVNTIVLESAENKMFHKSEPTEKKFKIQYAENFNPFQLSFYTPHIPIMLIIILQ